MGSGSSSFPKDDHFVIIGGGYGGVQLARSFKNNGAKYTIINEKEYFHHNVAAVRAAVVKGMAKKTLIPLKEVFGNNFKQGRVVGVETNSKTVKLESGEEIKYDVLIFATGSCGGFPNKLSDQDSPTAINLYDKVADKVEKAKSILVVGGGASGTELACEIGTKFPKKEVILLAARDKLITDETSDKFQSKLNSILARLNVKVIRGEKVNGLEDIDENGPGPFKVTTNKGTEVEADVLLKCIGIRVNDQAYRDSLKKVIKVVSVVSLGPTSGLGQMRNGMLLPEFAVKKLKSQDMMVPTYWKENGLAMPK